MVVRTIHLVGDSDFSPVFLRVLRQTMSFICSIRRAVSFLTQTSYVYVALFSQPLYRAACMAPAKQLQ